jgi:hypothetical protein
VSAFPSYRVEWTTQAVADLATAFAAYFSSFDGRRVANAERILNSLLEDDPERNGKALPEGLHHLVVSPLIAVYEIDSIHRIVRVVAVGHYPL